MDVRTLPDLIVAPSRSEISARYRDALRWLYAFATFEHKPADAYRASKHNLDRMRALLARLGNPHEKFRSVHIAGTKGKGSTAALCDSILRAAGIQTGLYTSPHLHTFCERIRVNGALIPRAAVVEGVERLRAIQPEFPDVVVFELITALAFDYFARIGVEFVVVETGIGGRLDATNVITPSISIITSISYDHMEVLGDTLSKIAREKAGIIKPRVPVVVAPQKEEAVLAVFEEAARERGAALVQVSSALGFRISDFGHLPLRAVRGFRIVPIDQNLDFQTLALERSNFQRPASNFQSPITNYQLHLLGSHQLANAAAAIAAMKTLGIRDEAIRDGIAHTRWAGRFEILEREPYLIVDGAHNGDSARQLVATIDALLDGARVQWIFGASNDKDVRAMLVELLPRSPAIILTRAQHPRAVDPRELARLAEQLGASAIAIEKVADALAYAHHRANEFPVTVVTGSLFAVAEARALVLRARGEAIASDD